MGTEIDKNNTGDSYKVVIEGKEFEVTFLDENGRVKVNDEEGFLDIRQKTVPDHYSMLVSKGISEGGESYTLGIEEQEEVNMFRVHTGGYDFNAEVLSSREAFLREYLRAAGVGKKEGLVKAPMPGLIVKTLVNEGDTIQVGDGVLIMEAMKMENEISSPINGVVKSLSVSDGDAVEKGHLLFEISPE